SEALKANGVSVLSAQVDMIPDNEVDPEGHLASVEKMIGLLEELDDVQNVYHNAILPEVEDED
ncbi:MAG: YebC/PmpR family DNA-binding transcriptional regulator, partial [Clostridia bacterium]|nr:YebC/PmpR family DNA-binding transcriptional regulator [Clostridia bacterium]